MKPPMHFVQRLLDKSLTFIDDMATRRELLFPPDPVAILRALLRHAQVLDSLISLLLAHLCSTSDPTPWSRVLTESVHSTSTSCYI